MRFLALFALILGLAATSPAGAVTTTWNPADKSAGLTLSNGNLTAATDGSANEGVRSTTSKTTGKFYFEVKVNVDHAVSMSIGVGTSAWVFTQQPGVSDSVSAGYFSNTTSAQGILRADSLATNISVNSYTTNDVISVAIDAANHLIYWAKNGVWQNSSNPSAGTGGISYVTTNPVFAVLYGQSGATTTYTGNFGAGPFAQTVPTGFSSWDPNTSKLSFVKPFP